MYHVEKEEEKGIASVSSQRKREVLSVKFQEKWERREESDACTVLRERTHAYMYVFPVFIAPKGKDEAETRVVEFYHLGGHSKMRNRVPSPLHLMEVNQITSSSIETVSILSITISSTPDPQETLNK